LGETRFTEEKGYRKTGRVRKRARNPVALKDRDLTLRIPRHRRIPIPDILFCTFKKSLQVSCPSGLCALFGGMSTFAVWLNNIYEPFTGLVHPATGPIPNNLQTGIATVGGVAGTLLGGSTINDPPMGYNRWLSAPAVAPTGIFFQFLVHKSRIKVFIDLGTSGDDGQCLIAPIYDYLPNTYNQMQATRHMKASEVSYLNPVRNTCSNEINCFQLLGLTVQAIS